MSDTVTGMSIGTLRRRGRRARHGLPVGDATVFAVRREAPPQVPHDVDTRVPYPVSVPVRVSEIDRAEWARVILELLESEAGGNRTELARLIGVDYQTIRRWIAGTNRVSDDSVRTVARAFRLNVTELLIRVGHFQADELTVAQPTTAVPDPGDEVGSLVKQAKLRPSTKRELYALIAERREGFEYQLMAEIRRLIEAEQRSQRSA